MKITVVCHDFMAAWADFQVFHGAGLSFLLGLEPVCFSVRCHPVEAECAAAGCDDVGCGHKAVTAAAVVPIDILAGELLKFFQRQWSVRKFIG